MWGDLDSHVAPVHGKTCRISVQNMQISSWPTWNVSNDRTFSKICFRCNATFHTFLCSCMWTVHVRLCAVQLQLHKSCSKCPNHPISSLFTTAAERNKLSTCCYFFAFSVFSPPWYECICDRFDYVLCCHSCAEIFKWNFVHFMLETVCELWRNLD